MTRSWTMLLALAWITACGGGGGSGGVGGSGGFAGSSGSAGAAGTAGSGATGGADPGPPCLPGGFCLAYPQLTDADLNAVHGSSGSDVWVVGARGTALRSVDGGATFTRVSTGIDAELHAVFVLSPESAWAVGAGGTLLRWDGATWNAESSGTSADLHDVVVDAGGTLWAAGGDAEQGVVISGQPGAFSALDVTGCRNLRALVARTSGEIVAGGGGSVTSGACIATIGSSGVTGTQLLDPHPHDPSVSVRSLLETDGKLFALVEGFNTSYVAEESGAGWSTGYELSKSSGELTDIAAKIGGGLWTSGSRVAPTDGSACPSSALSATRSIWSSAAGDLIAVGPGGMAAELDAANGCALKTTFTALVSDPYIYSDLPAVDGDGTPWFLVGHDVWEYSDDGWKKAFSFPDTYGSAYSEFVSGFAVCGSGSVRAIVQYKLGEDSFGPIYQPVAYEWERGMTGPAIGEIPALINTQSNTLRLGSVKCDATGGEWYSYDQKEGPFQYWYPRQAVNGVVPSSEPNCKGYAQYDLKLTGGGSPFFATEPDTVSASSTEYHDSGLLVFEGTSCRVLSTQDWPPFAGYAAEGESGAIELAPTVALSGASGIGDAWLHSETAIDLVLPLGALELAQLSNGAWKTVQVPLPADVLADLSAAESYMRRPSVTSAGGLALVSIRGQTTTWLLLFDGQNTEVVRGAGHSFEGGHHFFAQDRFWTLELPGTIFTRPL